MAQRALVAAGLLGIAADPLLRNGPWGLGLLTWMVLFAAVLTTIARASGVALSRESRTWLALAVLFAAGLSWRDADTLYLFDVLAMLASLVLLAMSLNALPVAGLASARIRDLLRAGLGTGLDVGVGAIPLALSDAELASAVRPSGAGNARRIAKALLITLPLLLVFTLLLTQADPVFESFVALPKIDLGTAISHIVFAGFFAWVVAGWLRRALVSHGGADATREIPLPFTVGTTDVALALGALNILFAAFIAVQIGWLFGGEALVLRTTGLSYAAYARHGFFELTGVACLLLPVLLSARALIPASDLRAIRAFQRLALPLVILLGAVMASAGARMNLYIRFYGISTDRLYATAFMIWLAIVFVWLALTVLRSRPHTFATGFVLSGFAVLFTLNVLDPDDLVARANLARRGSRNGAAAGPDLRYVAALGGDAIPLLISTLTAPTGAVDTTTPLDRCTAARIILRRWTGERQVEMVRHWPQWNFARMQAARAVRANEPQLRQLACPETPPAAP
jgi:hypothetical protein